MTRRLFFQTIGALSVFSVSTGAASRASRPTGDPAPNREVWRSARDVVRSGALGTIIWGQVSQRIALHPANDELRSVIDAMGLRQGPLRVSTLGSPGARGTRANATTILEFASGPPVYLVDSTQQETIIRGSRARLHIRDGQFRVTPCGA